MEIITTLMSFEFKTAGLFLLFVASSLSIFFSVHLYLSDALHKHKIAFICASLVLWTIAGLSGWHMAKQLLAVPSIIKTNPTTQADINAQIPVISYEFSAPVDLASLSVHTYPEIDLTITPHGYFGNIVSIGRKLTLTSKITLPYGEHYMIYLSNIEGPFTRGYGGEHLLEVNTTNLTVVDVIPNETETTIKPNQTFTVKLNEPVASEKEWTVTSNPEHSFTIRKNDAQTLAITPQTPLAQATQYTMTITYTPNPKIKKTLHFTTVKPPILAGIEPQGSGVNPAATIVITFDGPMDQTSVTDNLSINPEIISTHFWDSQGKTLTLSHALLPKDTAYAISLKKGMQTKAGGTMESDLTYQFHTAGVVGIAQIDPINGAKDVITTQPITLTFDQEVPPKIADFVKISPATTATISAQGRTLVLYPKKTLSYEKLYSITLIAGAPSVYGLSSTKDQTFTFTTSSPSLAVPYFKQQSNFTCNLAAARMLLAYRGVAVTEKQLIDIIGLGGKRGSGDPNKGYIDDYGTYWDPVMRGVNTFRPARLIKSGKLEDIIIEIKKGNPVMTWGQNGWSDPHDISWTSKDGARIKAINGMHSAVIRGYTGPDTNPTQILLNDPWRGQYAITAKEFMRRWGYLGVAMVIE